MTLALAPDQLLQLRLRAQGLAAPVTALAPLLAASHSLQAQDYNAAALGLRARSRGLVAEEVHRALHAGELCWTWLMRGTLHFVAAADLPWLLPVFGPQFIRLTARRYAQLGLDEAACARACALLRQVLADGPQSRAELKQRLAAANIPVAGQAAPHLLRRAALAGVLVCVPTVAGRPDYRLLESAHDDPCDDLKNADSAQDSNQDSTQDDLPDDTRDDAENMSRLTRRYLRAFGPATPADLARWSGLSLRLARTGFDALAAEITPVTAAGQPAALLNEQLPWLEMPLQRSLHLLPAFDALLLSHVERALILPPPYSHHIHPGGGIIRPCLLLDGVVRGRWQLKRSRRSLTLSVTPFTKLPPQRLPQLEAEVADVGRFLGQPARLQLEAIAS